MISVNHIVPLSMSSLDSQTSVPASTCSRHGFNASAKVRLFSPDQLMKIFMDSVSGPPYISSSNSTYLLIWPDLALVADRVSSCYSSKVEDQVWQSDSNGMEKISKRIPPPKRWKC